MKEWTARHAIGRAVHGTALVAHEHENVPSESGSSLYLRPLMIATEASLGVRASDDYLFVVIGSPVGAYFAGEGGIPAIRLTNDAKGLDFAFQGSVPANGNAPYSRDFQTPPV